MGRPPLPPSGPYADIGARIRLLREENGLTQRDLAQNVGLSPGGVALVELGHRKPSAENVTALAQLFRVEAAWILHGGEYRTREELEEAEQQPGPQRALTRGEEDVVALIERGFREGNLKPRHIMAVIMFVLEIPPERRREAADALHDLVDKIRAESDDKKPSH